MADFEFQAPTSRRPIGRYILIGVVALIMIGTLIWAVAVRQSNQNTGKKAPDENNTTSSQQKQQQNPSDPGTSTSDNTTTAPDGNSDDLTTKSEDASPSATGDKDQQAASDGTKELSGTGPRETIAIFVGAVLVGVVAYQFYLRRRLYE